MKRALPSKFSGKEQDEHEKLRCGTGDAEMKQPEPAPNGHKIATRMTRSTGLLIVLLIAFLVVLLRMQYVLVFADQMEQAVDTAAQTMTPVLEHQPPDRDGALLEQMADASTLDSLVLVRLTPSGAISERVVRGGKDLCCNYTVIKQALATGNCVQQTGFSRFGGRTYLTVEQYTPVSEHTLLYLTQTRYCPFFSHSFSRTVVFFLVFLMICLSLLLYSRKLCEIVIKPLESLKAKAKSLTQNMHAFEFMNADGDEIGMIYSAFEMLRDRQQRLDESLDYAKEIQSRILAQEEEFRGVFRDSTVFYQPLALVSGDFYWMKEFDHGTILVMGDCTGHGIPGALMTMMVISILDNIIEEANCFDTKNILWKLDQQLSSILNTNKPARDSYIKHGLDIIVLFIDREHKTIKLSSASTNLYIVKPLNSVEVVRGQRLFIGDGKIKRKDQVKSVYLKYAPKCQYYMATDGLFEQIGGEKRIPYGFTRFKTILFDHAQEGVAPAVDALTKDFFQYMNLEIQRDDITVIGFQI